MNVLPIVNPSPGDLPRRVGELYSVPVNAVQKSPGLCIAHILNTHLIGKPDHPPSTTWT